MAKQHKYVTRRAKTLNEAIEKAEQARNVRDRPAAGVVNIKPSLQPVIFQGRRFVYGHKYTDLDFVKELERRIGIVGELDPPTVIKIGGTWICVDGHHRIAAYNRARWRKPIKCFWFDGTVREAADEATRLNNKNRLNVTQKDRTETAWELVLLGKHSKAEIVKLCHVADGTVAKMRRVKSLYEDKGDVGAKLFRKRLGMALDEASWMSARLAFAGVEPKDRDAEEEAAKLAVRINARLTNRLSRDPHITARALEIYDPELPGALMGIWGVALKDPRLVDEPDAEPGKPSPKAWKPLPKGWKAGDPLPEL